MAILDFAQWVADLSNWGFWILFGLAGWELWHIISGTGSESHLYSVGKEKVGRLLGREMKKAKKMASREKTKELNEYVEEKKELDLIKDAQTEILEVEVEIDPAVTGVPPYDKTKLEDTFDKFKRTFEKANKEVRRLKRATFKSEKATSKMMQALKEAGVEQKDEKKVKIKLDQVLRSHEDVQTSFAEVEKENKHFERLLSGNDPAEMHNAVDIIKVALERAEGAQEEAYKFTESLIAEFEEYWKP